MAHGLGNMAHGSILKFLRTGGKTRLFAALAAALVLGMAVCKDANAADIMGTFIVTDIPAKYNGKYVMLFGFTGSPGSPQYAAGYDSFRAPMWALSAISGGSVSIPVWLKGGASERYLGSDTFRIIGICIYDKAEVTEAEFNSNRNILHSFKFTSVRFINGSAKRSYADCTVIKY